MGTVAVQPHPRFWLLLCGPKSGALDRLRFRLLGEIMRGCPANARGGHTALSQATWRDPSHKLKDAVSHMSAFQLTRGKSETGSGLVQSSQATIGELQGCPELSRYHWRALGLLPQSNGNSETGSPGLLPSDITPFSIRFQNLTLIYYVVQGLVFRETCS